MSETREIVLRARDGSERARTVVDADDYEWLSEYRWKLTAKGYAQREQHQSGGTWRSIRMHRAVVGLGCGDPRQVDHINGDRLDNRRVNLRIVTAGEQQQNVRRRPGLRGVAQFTSGTWYAHAKLNGVRHFLGACSSAEEAAERARAWRREHMPYAVD